MADHDSAIPKPDVEKKVTVVDGEQAVVERLPDGTARMVIPNKTEENAEEE